MGLGTQPRNRQTNRSENAEVSRSVQFLPSKATLVRRDRRLAYPTRPVGAFSSKQIRGLCGNCPCAFFSANRAGGMSECSCLVSQFAHACRLCFITERAERPSTRFTEPRAVAGQRCPESGLGDAMFYIVVNFFELLLPRNPDPSQSRD